jgi:hypothetical protein
VRNAQSFRQFIAGCPALNLSALADELGIDRVNLNKIINGSRKIPQAKRGQFFEGWWGIKAAACFSETKLVHH